MSKKNVFEDTYISIQGWMVSVLNLKGNELLAFALIYGFNQDGESEFKGSINYIMKWLNCSRPTAIKTTNSLMEKHYVIKRQEQINGVKFNRYSVEWDVVNHMKNNFTSSKETLPPLVKKFNQGSKETLLGGSKETLPNNIINSNIAYNIEDTIYPNLFSFDENGQRFTKEDVEEFDEMTYDEMRENHALKNSQKTKEKSSAKKEKSQADAIRWIKLLADLTGVNWAFDPKGKGPHCGKTNIGYVEKLFRKGYSYDDLEVFLYYMYWMWKDKPDMFQYLRPSTLLDRKKTISYIEEAMIAKTNPAFLEKIKKAKEAENHKNGTLIKGDVSNVMSEILKNI